MSENQVTPDRLVMAEYDDPDLRTKAVGRSWLCPGAGFAFLGWGGMALATFLASLATAGAIAWFAIRLSAAAIWMVLGGYSFALILWVVEKIAVKNVVAVPPKPRFLVAGFLASGLVVR